MMLKSKYLTPCNYGTFNIESLEGKDWQPVMDEGISITTQVWSNYQLGSGTLLGMIREDDGYIHHDTDIDIDIMIEDPDNAEKEAVVCLKLMNNHGFKIVRTQVYHDPRYGNLPIQLAFIHEESNIIFDLCFFYDIWGTDWCNVYEHGVFFRPPYSVNETLSYEFNGSTYQIPKEYGRYLKGRYGADWKTPKKGKDSGEKDAAHYLIVL